MEFISESKSGIYEVEKIITRKFFKSKKYYLIKWLCYPIYESTWEPKSNLKDLDFMIDRFEGEYPYSIDQYMYEIYCEEIKSLPKRRRKTKKFKEGREYKNNEKFLSKKRKFEFFSNLELEEAYLDKLKVHLHLNLDKRLIKSKESEIIIDLSSNSFKSDELFINEDLEKENNKGKKEKYHNQKLIMPEIV